MSWSVSAHNVREASDMNDMKSVYGELNEGEKEQLEAGKKVVVALIESGVAGRDKKFSVTISGHSNPNHVPTPGYANDAINISMYQQTE